MHPCKKFKAAHVFKLMQKTRHLSAYFCLPENVFISMVLDKRVHVRQLVFSKIAKKRKQEPKGKSARTFPPPIINVTASNYIEFIDWSKCTLTPLPIMSNVSTQNLQELINSNDLAEFELNEFP